MIGGAADLVESTKTEFEGAGVFSATHAGRNIAFGIREHGMGSIVNGLALHGGIVKPYGSTFLVFSDYMRPARAALGADGAAGRVGLDARLDRPRRGRSDAPAGRALRGPARDPAPLVHPARLTRTRPPSPGRSRSSARTARSALSLTRQKVPTLDRSELAPAAGLERGAYVLWESGEPDLILIATGSEVSLALDAGEADRRRERHRRPRRLDAVLGALRAAAADRTATRCCRQT